MPARAFSRFVSSAAELLLAQLSRVLTIWTAPGVIPFVAKTGGVVVPMVGLHERVLAANGQHKFSQRDREVEAESQY